MTKRPILFVCAALVLLPTRLLAQGTTPPLDAPNVVQISTSLVTAGQPTAASLAELKSQGFDGVIYLAPLSVPNAVRDEQSILERQGIAFVNIPIVFGKPTDEDFQAFATALHAFGDRKVLVHCEVNMRASSMVFLYRVIVGKESPDIAYESVARVWSPRGPWKRLLVSELGENGISFEPY